MSTLKVQDVNRNVTWQHCLFILRIGNPLKHGLSVCYSEKCIFASKGQENALLIYQYEILQNLNKIKWPTNDMHV